MRIILTLICLCLSTSIFACNLGDEHCDSHFSKAISYLEKAERLAFSMENADIGIAVSNHLDQFIENLKINYQTHDLQRMCEGTTLFFENLGEVLSECGLSSAQICGLVEAAFKELHAIGCIIQVE